MTGPWEQRLKNLAEGGTDWDVPAREDLVKKLGQLRSVLDKAASEPGITGESGTKATDTFSEAGKNVQKLADYLDEEVSKRVSDANLERERARGYLAQLSGGKLSPTQEAMVRGAAIGSTIVLGPISVLAGEGAVSLINGFLGNRREDDAKKYVEAVSNNLDSIGVEPAPTFPWTPGDQSFPAPAPNSPFGTGAPGTNAPSFQQYPDFDVDPKGPDIRDPGVEILDPDVDEPVGPVIEIPIDPVDPVDPIEIPTGPETNVPTPDGPVGSGVTTLPGPGGGHTIGGVPGSGSAGGGSGLGLGLAAGAAGGLARATKIGAGGIGGAGAARPGGGVKAGGGRGGGLLGKSGAAGGVGAPAGGSRGAAGGTRGGGMMGGGGAPGGAASGGRGGAGARGGMAGAAGGGRGDKKKEPGRGLGGPIAPNIEDDEDFGPRSENAGAGGRD
jgi:hypothetical protein